ncbi:GH3 auxin-responsive promoter family protein, partial [Pseudomonas sp. MPR-AND1A]|uniref:GH3 family domain-containing protein n=1 Tax=Pseudomonas sp. MPR-AND1A TaxID=2070600 RepID=UPI000CADA8CB
TLHAKRLQSLFPKTLFQGKGLLATEAPLTIPFLRYGALPFITDIFFEFKDESGNISLLSQVEENKKYRVILSHKGGFLR